MDDTNLPEHDPAAGTETLPPNFGPLKRAYAFCRNGFVHAVRTVLAGEPHPFEGVEMHAMGQVGDPQRDHVVDVTGVECHPGFLVDNKGNVAHPGTREDPLTIREPAYTDHHLVKPVPTAEQSEILSRPGTDAPAEAPGPGMTDAKLEQNPDAPRPENHENEHGVQEHHEPAPSSEG